MLLHISDRYFFPWAIVAITSRRELEQLHGKLKKNPGLDRTLTLGHAIGLHSTVPLSYQAIREPFILSSCSIFREQYKLSFIWPFIYSPSYLHLLWATQNNLGIGHPPEGLVAQWQSRVQCNCTVLSSSSVQDSLSFGFLCNCFTCFLDCSDHSKITVQPFLRGGGIFKY